VVSTNGDTHLGGDDIDDLVMKWLIDEFKKDQGIDVGKDKMVLQRLKEAAEKAKIELSTVPETEINLPFLTADASGPKHLQIKLSRSKLEQMVSGLVGRAKDPAKKALSDAGKSPSEIGEVVLVGGQTRMPMIQAQVREIFGKEPHKGVNPDEVVALGAAVQAGVLSGEVKDILLLDVTPLTLGIETLGGVMTPMIQRNTTIPTKKTEVFSTASDGQTSVEVVVTQGERPMARDNRLLGRFHLDGIPPAPRGVPQVEVTFDIDANGIVNVHARDKGTGKEQKITITASSGLSEAEIQKMVKDAEANEAVDKERKEAVEARNQLDSLVFQMEKMVGENRDKLEAAALAEVEQGITEAKKVLQENQEPKSAEPYKTAFDALQKASYKMAEQMYKQTGAAPDGGGGGAGESASSGSTTQEQKDVIDAEFEEHQ
jgi:molecular chaperone DnaK